MHFVTVAQYVGRSIAQTQKGEKNIDPQENSKIICLHLYCMSDNAYEYYLGKMGIVEMHYGPYKQWQRSAKEIVGAICVIILYFLRYDTYEKTNAAVINIFL